MKNVGIRIQETLGNELPDNGFDLIDIVPIPTSGDRMIQKRTLEEALKDFNDPINSNMMSYLIRVKPKKAVEQRMENESVLQTGADEQLDGMYDQDGKLNVPFIKKNAELLRSAGEYVLAENVYNALLKSGEDTAGALYGLGQSLEGRGKFEAAILKYEESIAYKPDVDVFHKLAALLIKCRRDRYAAEMIERALRLENISDKLRTELHKVCGNCWARLNYNDNARKHYEKALEIDSEADEIRSNLGTLYLNEGKLPAAIQAFREAISANRNNAKAYCGLGCCFLSAGRTKGAYDYFVRSLEMDPSSSNAMAVFNLIKCAYELKLFEPAETMVAKYVQNSPVNANLLYSLAGMQYHLGKNSEAHATAAKILKIKSDHEGAKEILKLTG